MRSWFWTQRSRLFLFDLWNQWKPVWMGPIRTLSQVRFLYFLLIKVKLNSRCYRQCEPKEFNPLSDKEVQGVLLKACNNIKYTLIICIQNWSQVNFNAFLSKPMSKAPMFCSEPFKNTFSPLSKQCCYLELYWLEFYWLNMRKIV